MKVALAIKKAGKVVAQGEFEASGDSEANRKNGIKALDVAFKSAGLDWAADDVVVSFMTVGKAPNA